MSNKTVAVIIVTYNRKKELYRCINAVLSQTKQIHSLIIVDNASTDNTINYLYQKKIISIDTVEANRLQQAGYSRNTKIFIYHKNTNTGGAGGFYTGMEQASKYIKFDFLWMMDDDGYPSLDCLELLLTKIEQYEYVMPVSIDIEDHKALAWSVRRKNGHKTINYYDLYSSWGEILEYVTPFNGVLLTRKCIEDVGFINPDLFIWGDEYDHYYRCLQKGYKPITFLKAIFYHPSQKLPLIPIVFGIFQVPYVDSKLRMICLARNYTYIYLHYDQKYKIFLKLLLYTWLFLITRHGDIEGWKLYLTSVRDGFKGDFSRHLKYLDN